MIKNSSKIKTSQIEYQGISVLRDERERVKKILQDYFPNIPLKQNLHVCFQYFGTVYRHDKHMAKEKVLFPKLGTPVDMTVLGIGVYKKNGKIMNIALLVDDMSFLDVKVSEEKTLFDYNTNPCPNITLYAADDTYEDDGKTKKTTSVKKSNKCFQSELLGEGEECEFYPFATPVIIKGRLAVFRAQDIFYRIIKDAPRLASNKALTNAVDELVHIDFAEELRLEKEEKKKADLEKLNTDNIFT